MPTADDFDTLLEDALELCHFHDEVTPHLLQGHLEIDYRNACKLFSQLRDLKVIAHVRLEEDEDGPRQIGIVNRTRLRLSIVN